MSNLHHSDSGSLSSLGPGLQGEDKSCRLRSSMEDAVTQTHPSVSGVEHESVTLDCTYETVASSYIFYWYKQPPGESLIFLSWQHSGGEKRNERLEDGKRSSLHITDSQLGDSGSYLCAVRAQ
uniref:Ig-like domain-containing protein n=1 Tax=Terrapene triunguis TaxID=2587831 RepID=A0A674IV63_9SAUR